MPVKVLLKEDHSSTPIMAKIRSMVMRPTTRFTRSTTVTWVRRIFRNFGFLFVHVSKRPRKEKSLGRVGPKSEECRVGNECVCTSRSRAWRYHEKYKDIKGRT